jgi:isopentenyl-diphosphate delta-isomerase
VPTAVSVAACVGAGLTTIASGGMRSGYDVARAIALGARAGGMAAPMLRAQRSGGEAGVRAMIEQVVGAIRAVCLLTGCRTAAELSRAPRHLGAPLRAYLDDLAISPLGSKR